MLKGQAFEKFHHNKRLAIVFPDLVNRANVGMVQRRCGAGFPAKPFQCLRIIGHIFGKKFEGNEAAKFGVFSFVDYPHSTAAEFLDNSVVRYGRPKHVAECYVDGCGPVNDGWVSGNSSFLIEGVQALTHQVQIMESGNNRQNESCIQKNSPGNRYPVGMIDLQ